MGWCSMQSEPRGDYRRSTYLILTKFGIIIVVIIITIVVNIITVIIIIIIINIMFKNVLRYQICL